MPENSHCVKKEKTQKEECYPKMAGIMELCESASLQDYGGLDVMPEFRNAEKLWTNQWGCNELVSTS